MGDLIPLRLKQVAASHIDILEQKNLDVLSSKRFQLLR